ncbi:hypothetical protein ES288_A08G081200v1 [Gossypium darwinii]|uniref:Uncharacterized protein n=1 Tax=Gossypium darwinii TaxID=34276 RepID=A0A5D2FGY4_GOSDA|nr:hypothetical protein ES288_A08G081200v1 [Gossypium darwinii]
MAKTPIKYYVFSETCYLTRIPNSTSPNPKFCLRWFTPVTESSLFGGLSYVVILPDISPTNVSEIQNGGVNGCFLIELNFPTVPVTNFNSAEASLISKAWNDAPLIDVKRTTTGDDIFVIPQEH